MSIEQIPTTWTDADEDFFRIVARALSCHFVAGASSLLAGYDDESLPSPRPSRRRPVLA